MADFRSVYHLAYSDALRLPAEESLALAYRLPVYSGVIAMRAEAQQKAEAAAAEGRAFLAENAQRDGVTVLASGLQYEVLVTGEGARPTREDNVRTHYHGTLIDGSVFDSSYERGQPAEFPVGGVIAGWTEALQLMNAGSKWRLYVPSELAYGAQGVGSIPPHSVLVFDVELLDVL